MSIKISVEIKKGENFTPAGLMIKAAKKYPNNKSKRQIE